jgi:uncharacterized protein involved in exopolysaccharide biosynthesis
MSIVQFLRIFWARRILILAATLSCLVGAIIVTLVLPPRWEAHTRLMLNLMKPDPVTGMVISGPASRAYAATQVELITDYAVAGQVADQLGWLSDPALIAAYQRRSKSDKRDFRRWLAQLVIDGTKAKILEDSNILEITYVGETPEAAKGVADALRTAYLNASLAFQRDDAQRNAEWFTAQADKAKAAYDAAVAARTDYEKANGIVMADDKTDIDSAHLQALALQSGVAPAIMAPTALQSSASAVELAQVDAQIAEATKTLGPNHPDLLALRARRKALEGLVAKDQAAARAAAGAASSASAATVGALDRAVTNQKARVIEKSDKIGKLTQLQSEVDLRRDEFTATAAKAAQFRQEAALADSGVTPLGVAVTPKAPLFPNYLLIIPGSLVLGAAIGVLVALLMELFGRRVRGVEDLATGVDLPLLAVVAAAPNPRSSHAFQRRWRPPSLPWPGRRKAARA